MSVLTDRVSEEFTHELKSTRHAVGDPVLDSQAQCYLSHVGGDSGANFIRSSDISSNLSVTPDRDLYEPALIRANTLTANKSLIEGTDVGNGVPDDEL